MKKPQYTESSGNVFADLGVHAPEEAKAKAELATEISKIIASQHLKQKAAADRLGIDQPKVSALLRGKLEDFSTERLLRFITLLGRDVEIVVKEPSRPVRRGALHVVGV